MQEEETRSLNARIEHLEQEVRELRRRMESLSGSPLPEIPRHSKDGAEPARVEIPPAPDIVPFVKVTASPSTGTPAPVAPDMASPESSPPEESPPSRSREEWETLIGGKLLNRIGALALIIGMGFFLKYAFDSNWISETVRVLIGGGIGVLLLAGAWRFQSRGLQIFAQGLLGAGISILYLSVYASHNFYHLVSLPVAFVLMSAVTVSSLLQALRYNSLAVSLLGWCGGFLTPFLLAAGESNEAGLFIYIALLDMGLLGVLFRKPSWAALEPLTFLATYVIFFSWYGSYSGQADPLLTLVFLAVFWGLFFALDFICIMNPVIYYPSLRQIMHALNAVFFALGLQEVIDPQYPGWLAPIYLALGAVYLLAFRETRRRLTARGSVPSRQALTAAILLVVATGLKLSGFALAMAWSVEAAALVWCGVYFGVATVWMAGLALLGLAAMGLYETQFIPWSPSRGVFFWNVRALAFGVLAASLGSAVFPLRRVEIEQAAKIREILHYCWAGVLFVLCTLETYEQCIGRPAVVLLPFLALCWMVYALPLSWAGLRTKTEPVLLCGLGTALLASAAGFAAGLMTFDPIQDFHLFLNPRAFILLALMTGAVLLSLRIHEVCSFFPRLQKANIVFPLALVFLAFSLLTGETMDIFRKSIALLSLNPNADIAQATDNLENFQQMSLSGVWMLYSILLIAIGMWRRLPSLRIIAIALFGFTILKIFIYDLSFLVALYRIVSFLGLGIILMAVSYLYQRYKAVIFESTHEPET